MSTIAGVHALHNTAHFDLLPSQQLNIYPPPRTITTNVNAWLLKRKVACLHDEFVKVKAWKLNLLLWCFCSKLKVLSCKQQTIAGNMTLK